MELEPEKEIEDLIIEDKQLFKDLLYTHSICWLEKEVKGSKVIQLVNMYDLKVYVTMKFTDTGLYINEYGEKYVKRASIKEYSEIVRNYQEKFSKKRSLLQFSIIDLRPKEKSENFNIDLKW